MYKSLFFFPLDLVEDPVRILVGLALAWYWGMRLVPCRRPSVTGSLSLQQEVRSGNLKRGTQVLKIPLGLSLQNSGFSPPMAPV